MHFYNQTQKRFNFTLLNTFEHIGMIIQV